MLFLKKSCTWSTKGKTFTVWPLHTKKLPMTDIMHSSQCLVHNTENSLFNCLRHCQFFHSGCIRLHSYQHLLYSFAMVCLSTFAFAVCAFGVNRVISHSKTNIMALAPYVSSRSFTVSDIRFKSLIISSCFYGLRVLDFITNSFLKLLRQ